MICTDPELSKLDNVLAKKYALVLEASKRKFSTRQYQRYWLENGRNACGDKECLRKKYLERIKNFDFSLSPQKEQPCIAPTVDWNNYQWHLIAGAGVDACEDFIAYLKSRPKSSPPPICTEERLPKTKNWSRPKMRLLNAEERKIIIDSIPREYRIKAHPYQGPTENPEWMFTDASKLWLIQTKFTDDEKTNYFLGVTYQEDSCYKATHCSLENTKQFDDPDFQVNFVHIDRRLDDYYYLYPMTEDGKKVDWSHPLLSNGGRPPRADGELIYFKGKPYWLDSYDWFQPEQDKPLSRSIINIHDKVKGIFRLIHLAPSNGVATPMTFDQLRNLDDVNSEWCSFGYFNKKLLESPDQEGAN